MEKQVLIFGGSGLVGSCFVELSQRIFKIVSPDADQVDIVDKDNVFEFLKNSSCDTVINFAAFTNVEEAESQKGDREETCFGINAKGAKNIAEACKILDKHLIHISTEYVFDGRKSSNPYTEEDNPNPINWYGATKYYGEQFVLGVGCSVTIVRISMPFRVFFEPKKDIARFFLEQLKNKRAIQAIQDQKVTPTLVNDIVYALHNLVRTKRQGIYHISAKTSISPYNFAKLIAQKFDLDDSLIKPVVFNEYNKNKKGKLLKNSWLDPAKFETKFGEGILHTTEESIDLFKSLFKQVIDGKG